MTIKPTSRESVVELELVARVEALGGIAEKVTVLGRRGFFDRLVLLQNGRVFFVQVKKPRGGRISAHQRARHTAYRMLWASVVLIKTSDDIDRMLK